MRTILAQWTAILSIVIISLATISSVIYTFYLWSPEVQFLSAVWQGMLLWFRMFLIALVLYIITAFLNKGKIT